VAQAILSGIRRSRFHIVIGFDSWFIWFMQRLFPWLVRRVTDAELLRALSRQAGVKGQLTSGVPKR
jgi:hypothetical protein